MPIPPPNSIALQLRSWMDEEYSGFTGWPESQADVNSRWANIADTLLATVIPPSLTAVTARAAFMQVMQAMSYSSQGILILQTAFMAYATTLAAGMAPAFIATPPPMLPPFILTGLVTRSAEIEANNIANVLTTWARTGTATPAAGGPPIFWQ